MEQFWSRAVFGPGYAVNVSRPSWLSLWVGELTMPQEPIILAESC
jgi:hypothetical protein